MVITEGVLRVCSGCWCRVSILRCHGRGFHAVVIRIQARQAAARREPSIDWFGSIVQIAGYIARGGNHTRMILVGWHKAESHHGIIHHVFFKALGLWMRVASNHTGGNGKDARHKGASASWMLLDLRSVVILYRGSVRRGHKLRSLLRGEIEARRRGCSLGRRSECLCCCSKEEHKSKVRGQGSGVHAVKACCKRRHKEDKGYGSGDAKKMRWLVYVAKSRLLCSS